MTSTVLFFLEVQSFIIIVNRFSEAISEEPIPLSLLSYQEDIVRLVPLYVSSGCGCSRP